MFLKFNKLCIDTDLHQEWEDYLESMAINNFSPQSLVFLHQHVLNSVLQLSLKDRNAKLETVDVEKDVKLEKAEEQTLRYVAGYILFSLKKSIKNTRSTEGMFVVDILSCWGSKKEQDYSSFLEYTKHWVEKCNRGGLINCSDNFYVFIRNVENIARTVFNTSFMASYCGEDLRSVLLERFNESGLIQGGWDNLTRQFSNKQLTEKLKIKILTKWVNLRAHAFVDCWLQILRRKLSKSTDEKKKKKIADKGEPSLRKRLSAVSKSKGASEMGEPSMRKTLK